MLLVHGQEGTKSHPFSAIIHLVLFSSWTAGLGWLPTSYQGKSKFSCETWKPFTLNPDPASAPFTPFAKLTHWEAATPHLCCSPKCHICCMSLTGPTVPSACMALSPKLSPFPKAHLKCHLQEAFPKLSRNKVCVPLTVSYTWHSNIYSGVCGFLESYSPSKKKNKMTWSLTWELKRQCSNLHIPGSWRKESIIQPSDLKIP